MAEIENYHYWKEYNEADQVVSSQEMWELLKDRKVSGFRIVKFKQLDGLLEGFQEGELIVISGLTKHGKTCFCQSLTMQMVGNGDHALWFTFEVPERAFLSFMEDAGDMPLFFMPQQLRSKDMVFIENKIKEAIIKHGIKAVFIDHLHYLLDMRKNNVSLEIGAIMRFLKEIAIKYSLVIFLVAHTQKIDSETEPSAGSIRDSSFIGQEADVVLIILRLAEENRANLKVEFTRRTGVFQKKIKLIKHKFFEEMQDGKPERDNKKTGGIFGYSESDD